VLALAPDVGRFGPLTSLPTAAQDIDASAFGLDDEDLLAPGAAVLGMLAWIAAAFAAGAALLVARDVD
jgi:hypothetical protein